MPILSRWRTRLAGVVCALSLAGTAGADTLLDTGTPGGWLGYYGFDVFVGQSVAIAFTPTQDYAFDNVSLWLMSNDFDAAGRTLTVSLRTDSGSGATPAGPSGTTLEFWNHTTGAVGWTPLLETLDSVSHPLLHAGTTYWIVAESNEPALVDPVWVAAGNGPSYWMGNIDFQSGPAWQIGQSSGPPGVVINATAVPEPSVLLLGAVGVPLLLGVARRRAKALKPD